MIFMIIFFPNLFNLLLFWVWGGVCQKASQHEFAISTDDFSSSELQVEWNTN